MIAAHPTLPYMDHQVRTLLLCYSDIVLSCCILNTNLQKNSPSKLGKDKSEEEVGTVSFIESKVVT